MIPIECLSAEKKKTVEEILKLLDGWAYKSAMSIISAVTTSLQVDSFYLYPDQTDNKSAQNSACTTQQTQPESQNQPQT